MKWLRKLLKSNKTIYKQYQKYRKYRADRQKAYFNANCMKVISKVQKDLHESGHKFYFAFGTLLGIIRENKLLENDMDIDVIVYCEDQVDVKVLQTFLMTKSFHKDYEFAVREIGIVQHAFTVDKIRVDIHYCFAKNSDLSDYVYVLFNEKNDKFDVAKFECLHLDSILHNFHGTQINVPSDTEAFLSKMYGLDWQIPNKKYMFEESPCVTILCNMGYLIKK